ncbi:hypothetical protein ACFVAJ_19115 [Agromyces sp. NPDC057679]|uniref:hypothetical protein n=1 Tax=Agromyces sp. NPDC057679 TaxID=3346207 RepID=UPI00366E925D
MAGTTLEQFRNSILNPAARRTLGISMDDEQAAWVAADQTRLENAYSAWLVTYRVPAQPATQLPPPVLQQRLPPPAATLPPPTYPPPAARPVQTPHWAADQEPHWAEPPSTEPTGKRPSGAAGFVFALAGAVTFVWPIICVPISIAAIVICSKELKSIPPGGDGRGLAGTGLGISIGITVLALASFFSAMSSLGEITPG